MATTAVQDIAMPRLSDSMEEGTVLKWVKQVGDEVAVGEELVEIETDKAQMDFEFQEEGVLAKLLKQSGEKDVAVGNVSFAHARARDTHKIRREH